MLPHQKSDMRVFVANIYASSTRYVRYTVQRLPILLSTVYVDTVHEGGWALLHECVISARAAVNAGSIANAVMHARQGGCGRFLNPLDYALAGVCFVRTGATTLPHTPCLSVRPPNRCGKTRDVLLHIKKCSRRRTPQPASLQHARSWTPTVPSLDIEAISAASAALPSSLLSSQQVM